MRQRRRTEPPGYAIAEVDLEQIDATVLRCYANVGETRALAAADVARSLRISLRQVQAVLRRLGDYRLIEPAPGTDGGRDAHSITRAGQIYLLER